MTAKLTHSQHQADRQALEAMIAKLQGETLAEQAAKQAREARSQQVEDHEINWIG